MGVLGRQTDIGNVVVFAALLAALAAAILILDSRAARAGGDAGPRLWLLAALTSFITAAAGLELGTFLPLWVSAGLVIGGVVLGLAAARTALLMLLRRPPRKGRALGAAGSATIGQTALAATLSEPEILFVTSSAINGPLAGVFSAEVWRAARARGFDAPALLAAPFALISAIYAARLAMILAGASVNALLTVTAGIAFALSFSGVAWVFGASAIRAYDLRRRLEWSARHDPLTGLLNRAALESDLQAGSELKGQANDVCLAIDLDRFKEINDSLGHPAGDAVLSAVGARLRDGTASAGARVYRTGGDEFLVLAENAACRDPVELGHDLRLAIAVPVTWEGRCLSVDASLGIAFARREDDDEGADLLRRADVALYAAKSGGRSRVVTWSPDLGGAAAPPAPRAAAGS